MQAHALPALHGMDLAGADTCRHSLHLRMLFFQRAKQKKL
jgi:hypothetical protein